MWLGREDQAASAGSHAVALELEVDDALVREGRAREIVHAVQNARKAAGLEVSDRIALVLDGHPELLEAATAHEDVIAGEVLATSVQLGSGLTNGARAEVDGLELRVGVSKA